MAWPGLLLGFSVVAGAVHGLLADSQPSPTAMLVVPVAGGWLAWCAQQPRVVAVALVVGFCAGSSTLSTHARTRALDTSLRAVLDAEQPGFALSSSNTGTRSRPIATRAVLVEDASQRNDVTTFRARVTAVHVCGRWHAVDGTVGFTVGGTARADDLREWRAGRSIEAFATFRRPSVYLNEGVGDMERALALDGVTLLGSVKNRLLVDVAARGTWVEEVAAEARRAVRASVNRWVGPHAPVSAGIVAAVLIGDRTGLPDETRQQLQTAGTYHVIAISGGNIAILTGLTLAVFLMCGLAGRPASIGAVVVLITYAHVVMAGPSVWRATLMAAFYLGARLVDQRTPPWHAIGCAVVLLLAVHPLDVQDVGFMLTFGATAALVEGARRASLRRVERPILGWVVMSIVGSAAIEIALMPVSARVFSRVTAAGLVLNLAAVPLMAGVQIAGLVVSCFDGVDLIAAPAGWIAHQAATALVGSARLVEHAPWLAGRVPPPSLWLVTAYYGCLAVVLTTRGRCRRWALGGLIALAAAIVSGQPASWLRGAAEPAALRLVALDVGQGDSTLLQFPDRSTMLVDAGGAPFGTTFDIGWRVLAPALWARGVRGLETFVVTHGDPDHIGGAGAVVDGLKPLRVWEGVPVTAHEPLKTLLDRARDAGSVVQCVHAGEQMSIAGARIRVLHPLRPEWERLRVRNDDSVVLEVVFSNVAILLMGDVGASVERTLLPTLTPAKIRILKAAHHGSRTSTSQELLDRWRPGIAIISAGRGNVFGHPAPDVLTRLNRVGARVFRTDRDGQITIETDGRDVRVMTYVGGKQ